MFPGQIPAMIRYDGPAYRVLRSFLREWSWPPAVKIGVLSARYGLMGALAPTEFYDQRMTIERAEQLAEETFRTLINWSRDCSSLTVLCGKEYLPALRPERFGSLDIPEVRVADGAIGMKLRHLSGFLQNRRGERRRQRPEPRSRRLMYFLPDWDDMLDPAYDFDRDSFSAPEKRDRNEIHAATLMRPYRVCDGILVSLAQRFKGKGALRKFAQTDPRALAPELLRLRFGLGQDQLLFGDCGAFSYVKEPEPTITVEQAASLYELHQFDFGASVDHIPAPFFSPDEQERRVNLTREKAAAFIEIHRHLGCRFTPVGVVQGMSPESYAFQLPEYVGMGYEHVGIGGLVFRSDSEIAKILCDVADARKKLGGPLWLHAFGIFRPRLQPLFRELGVTSFDSASYLRKAWLRSDQNYLGVDGRWYAAVRIPVSADPRTKKKLNEKGIPLKTAEKLESEALKAVHLYGKKQLSLQETRQAVLAYDDLVDRNEKGEKDLAHAYEVTLEARPWEKCPCPVCSALGIDVAVFRGSNRNKRRGIHNTWLLFERVRGNF